MAVDPRENVTPSVCPYCGYMVTAAWTLDDDMRPLPGDVSVCIACERVATFGRTGALESVGDEATYLAALPRQERIDVEEIRHRIQRLRMQDPGWPKGAR